MNLTFSHPWLLTALLLAPLPLLRHGLRVFVHPGLVHVPGDLPSRVLFGALRLIATAALALLIVAAAGPYADGGSVRHVGTGAQIVLVFDRSGSMSENLSRGADGEAAQEDHHEAKIAAARRLLLDFMGRRKGDMFGVVAFASSPIGAAPLTDDREMTQAALASAEARSMGFTSLARALGMALDYFRGRPYTAARVILLVSDGGAEIRKADAELLRSLFAQRRASLIWIYTRGEREPSVLDGTTDASFSQSLSMHEYFAGLGVPYQLLEATSSESLRSAVREVGSLTNLPTYYEEHLPRRDLAPPLYTAALLLLALLLAAKGLELRQWSR